MVNVYGGCIYGQTASVGDAGLSNTDNKQPRISMLPICVALCLQFDISWQQSLSAGFPIDDGVVSIYIHPSESLIRLSIGID